MITFAPCKCNPNDAAASAIRRGLLSTFNSILAIFDDWELSTANLPIEFVVLEHERCAIFLGGVDTRISFPLICGTRLWIEWLETPVAKLVENAARLTCRKRKPVSDQPRNIQPRVWAASCVLCDNHTGPVPTTLNINGTRQFQQIYSVIDSARPRVIKGPTPTCQSACYINGTLIESKPLHTSANPILTTSGSLATQRVYPITQTFVKKLGRLVEWARNGSLTAKQAQLESNKLFVGNIDGVFSARAAYQSHEDYDDSCQSRLVSGFERNCGSRYQQLKTTTVQRFAYPLNLYKLIRASHHVTSNRMLHTCEEGFLAIGYVTESESAGMQYTTVLGIEFESTKTWDEFKSAIESARTESTTVGVLWSDMQVRQLQLPIQIDEQVAALARARCDFTRFNDDLYYAAGFPATPTTSLLFSTSSQRFTPITLDYIRRILSVTIQPPNLGLIDFTIPCINSSHAPKIMQSEYHLKQAINPYAPEASRREVGKMFLDESTTTPPLGSSILNVPTIETRCCYVVDLFNDEDGVVLSEEFASRLQSINYRTATLAARDMIGVHQTFSKNLPIQPNDILCQVEAADATLTSAYFLLKQARRGLWNVHFRREYTQRSVFFESVVVSARNDNTCAITITVCSYHATTVGDKLTTLHGQKCTSATVRRGIDHDMLISATCLKRLPLGEFIYGATVAAVLAGKLPREFASACFGYEWLFMPIDRKREFIAAVLACSQTTRGVGHDDILAALNGSATDGEAITRRLVESSGASIIIYTLRLTQEADTTLSYSSASTVVRDPWVGQNLKGHINTGASCITLPGMQSLERMGLTRTEYMVRRSAEDAKGYSVIDGIALDKSAKMTLQVLSQFNTFNLHFNK